MGASNRGPDVKVVQDLLNRVPAGSGGPLGMLTVDGVCGTKTIAAIQRFQSHHFGLAKSDGRVDPDGPTLRKLNEFDQPAVPQGPDNRPVWGRIHTVKGEAFVFDPSLLPPGAIVKRGPPSTVPARPGMVLREGMAVQIDLPGPDHIVRIQLISSPTVLELQGTSTLIGTRLGPNG
jgi:peptidoglycan hydrolase-like protein with peptidoglycan-binding domain